MPLRQKVEKNLLDFSQTTFYCLLNQYSAESLYPLDNSFHLRETNIKNSRCIERYLTVNYCNSSITVLMEIFIYCSQYF